MNAIITFSDGTTITAERNGDCFITDVKPDFPDDLATVTISDTSYEYVLHDAELIECASVDGKYWFAFNEKPEEQILKEEIAKLQMQNEFLEGCIMEMSEEVYK